MTKRNKESNVTQSNIYILSGLGADARVFQNIDFSGLNITYINWISPSKNESIENYSSRLLEQIPSKEPILIALSFGGMIAIEIAKQIETKKLILISTAKTKYEIPLYYRLFGKLSLDNFLSAKLLKQSNFITNFIFGTNSNSDQGILNQMLLETDPIFLKWAINKILNWSNQFFPLNCYHIHGSTDRLLPINFVNCDYTIKNAGHLMIINRAKEIEKLIKIHIL